MLFKIYMKGKEVLHHNLTTASLLKNKKDKESQDVMNGTIGCLKSKNFGGVF